MNAARYWFALSTVMGAVVMAGPAPPAPSTAPAPATAPEVVTTEPAEAEPEEAEPAKAEPPKAEPPKAERVTPEPVKPDPGAGGAAADDEFIEFLGADDVGDSAWWEFLENGEARKSQSRVQDSKQ